MHCECASCECGNSGGAIAPRASMLGALAPMNPAQQVMPAEVDPAEQQRQVFDDFMSLLSVVSIVLNLSR